MNHEWIYCTTLICHNGSKTVWSARIYERKTVSENLKSTNRGIATNSGQRRGGGRLRSGPFLYSKYESDIKESVSSSC